MCILYICFTYIYIDRVREFFLCLYIYMASQTCDMSLMSTLHLGAQVMTTIPRALFTPNMTITMSFEKFLKKAKVDDGGCE